LHIENFLFGARNSTPQVPYLRIYERFNHDATTTV
jgi:hypothetical protein